ncbi:unnamed protein product [Cuscuta epithymum]|uniref:F-box domain-containing protein n=1 Tax=Cuscuta epithymum TaxID=186058 RepID=A0AAV0DCF0_9ASTE|nr:unnamed protein product [Cuscuta epithymum]
MASESKIITYRSRRSKPAMDLMSQLPHDVKDRIMESLDTRDAARMALVSNQWKNVWLQHDRLVFDEEFFGWIAQCLSLDDDFSAAFSVMNHILMLRVGPIKMFVLEVSSWNPTPLQSDIDRWCIYLSRNGIEELHLTIFESISSPGVPKKLPVCIISSLTLIHLELDGFTFAYPAKASNFFPVLKSLEFRSVDFMPSVSGIVFDIPNLEHLAIYLCDNIHNFVIKAPKLKNLIVYPTWKFDKWKWFELHFPVIQALVLSTHSFACTDRDIALALPAALNLRMIELDNFKFIWGKHFVFALLLIQKCPKLSKLKIVQEEDDILCFMENGENDASPEDSEDCLIKKDLEMLKTLKVESFCGTRLEVLFIKTILLKSPTLKEVIIVEARANVDATKALNISKEELLSFSCASAKAQIVFR